MVRPFTFAKFSLGMRHLLAYTALMNGFHWLLDGSIVGVYLLVTMAAGLAMRRYVGGVDDFLVAGREMDVFLGNASLAATEFGIVTCM